MDVAWSAPQGPHYHVGVMPLLKKSVRLLNLIGDAIVVMFCLVVSPQPVLYDLWLLFAERNTVD